jgi:hypothetical protein
MHDERFVPNCLKELQKFLPEFENVQSVSAALSELRWAVLPRAIAEEMIGEML